MTLAANDFWGAIQAPAYSRPATAADAAAQSLRQRVAEAVAVHYRLATQEPQFFKVAADTTPDMVRKNFANQLMERGASALRFDGPELSEYGLDVLALYQGGELAGRQMLGVAMSRARPGLDEYALVMYFALQPKAQVESKN